MNPKHIQIGALGEGAVRNHLKRKGFVPIESNFRAKTGEIDLILKKNQKVHFIEVKTVSCETASLRTQPVSHGTYRPEDNVHRGKLRKLLNTIQVWLSVHKYEGDWQLDIAAVYLDIEAKKASVRMTENVIVE